MTVQEVSNPTLYRALSRAFGEVRVTHTGEPLRSRGVMDADDRPRLEIVHFGEAYKVCCPFCRDREFNLSVNHRYGTFHWGLGRPLSFLANCFARGCLADRRNRDDLFNRLGGADRLAEARIHAGSTVPVRPAQLPESFIRLDRLQPAHPVRAKLAALGHNPDRLAKVFRIGYCPDADVRLADERIVAPVRRGGTIVGWLAVEFVEDDTCFLSAPGLSAGRLLYNLDRARKYPTTVVVPKPDWVWRVGTVATSSLTELAPERLAGLLRRSLPSKELLFVCVEGRHQSTEVVADILALQHRAKVALVRLPPAAITLPRAELKQMIRAAAAERGMVVSFRQNG